MEKFIKSFVFIFLITILSNSVLFAKNDSITLEYRSVDLVNNNSFFTLEKISNAKVALLPLTTAITEFVFFASPPTVTSPVYYCQNAAATALTATASSGGTLNWYGTNATGGTASVTAPTPSTVALGTTSYYVSETVGGVESTRSKIDVIVVANNGATILSFRCDASQILPADRTSSVFFDWANNPLISNSYNYTYTIQGASAVTGNTSVSHVQVFNMLPGQSATLTLSSATHPCVSSQTITCSVPCGTSTVTPNFPVIAPFCIGTPAPLLNPTSPNGITGTWSPAIISNTTSGSYVFTPNSTLFPCAATQTLNVIVTPLVTPTFTGIPATVCQNATAPILPTSSNNTPAISGTWSPASVNTAVLGSVTYTFTPNTGQCASTTLTKVTINIVPVVTPNFANIPPFCSGTTAPLLTSTSPNGIVGTWAPSTVSNTASSNYVFTPNPNQCTTTQTLNVTIIPKRTPNFSAIAPFCSGSAAPILATTSPNGITGTWSPSTISNTTSGSYIFTPNTSECANNQTLAVAVIPLVQPNFSNFSICMGGITPILNTTSPNGIRGTWSPAIVNNMASAAYVFSPNSNQCATSKTINVTVNPSNTLLAVDWTVSEPFAKNQVVTVIATGTGDYEYQLDDGPFQESPVFEYVSLGTHSITVQEKNGCSIPITRTNVLVINYPKFFTPNEDGYNDTWNVFTLQNQLNSKILIFDRHGKFLKEIFPNGTGWDGTYIGQPMPANDYWFSIEYTEQDVPKKFRSHFSLKR
ncbi:T9SS type B sorting domain-containing protein [Flavobacterium sp. LB2P6]|uniref:T9SS type B sorting domain-containing protein n=1 Tax=Flavobacterium sp. LB2P6 TaxID=3401714 RepID=UPI003AAAE70C